MHATRASIGLTLYVGIGIMVDLCDKKGETGNGWHNNRVIDNRYCVVDLDGITDL